MEPSAIRKAYSRAGAALLALLALSFGLTSAARLFCARFGVTIEIGSWMYYLLTMAPLYLIAMPAAALLLRRIPAAPPADKRSLTIQQLGIAALICIALLYAGNLAGGIVTSLIGALAGSAVKNVVAELLGRSDLWAMLTATTVAAPMAEELFFRKLLIGRLRGHGQRAAVVVSAAAFSLSHGNLSQAFYAFTLGLAFGYIYLHTNRIGYTIALHLMINTLGGAVALFVQKAGTIALMVYGPMMLAAVAAGGVMFFRYRRSVAFTDELWPDHPPQWKKPAFVNVGMGSFFIACGAVGMEYGRRARVTLIPPARRRRPCKSSARRPSTS